MNITEREVRVKIIRLVEKHGSARKLAASWGVSPTYLSDVLNERRLPGPKILEKLGLERVEVYRRVPRLAGEV